MRQLSDIRLVLTQLEQVCEDMARQKGVAHLSGPQGHVLVFLSKSQDREVFVKDIEQELRISKSVASNLVKRMVKNGFIDIVPSVKDKRYKQVILTADGQSKIAPLLEFHNEMIGKIFAGVSREDMDQLNAVITQLNHNITRYKGENHA